MLLSKLERQLIFFNPELKYALAKTATKEPRDRNGKKGTPI